ncbi:MAG: murein hydrolase activator EnvC family protein [Nitrospinaceae bacterium]
MRKSFSQKFWMFFLISLASTGMAGGTFADPIAEINAQIDKEKSELEKLKAKIEKREQSIQMAGSKEKSVLRTLRRIESKLELKERELKIYRWNNRINQKKIARLTQNIQKAEQQLKRQKHVLGERLRAIYKEGRMFPIKVLFSAENFNDLLQRIKYMETITAYDSSLFHRYGERLKALEVEKQALLKARARLMEVEKNTREKQKEIQNKKIEKSNFLRKLKREKKLSIQVRKELVKASDNLNNLILKLLDKLDRGEGLEIADRKGRLKMPVKGPFLNKFGKKRNKQYETYIIYNGVNIKVPKGTPVRAVFQGKVLFASDLEGYGNLIILGHGKDYHSLYGHLDKIITAVGKTVRTGQIIGRSGDTGSLVGETLYFEMRHNGKPVEPTRWFQLAQR